MSSYLFDQLEKVKAKSGQAELWYRDQQKKTLPVLEKELELKRKELEVLRDNKILPLFRLKTQQLQIANLIHALQQKIKLLRAEGAFNAFRGYTKTNDFADLINPSTESSTTPLFPSIDQQPEIKDFVPLISEKKRKWFEEERSDAQMETSKSSESAWQGDEDDDILESDKKQKTSSSQQAHVLAKKCLDEFVERKQSTIVSKGKELLDQLKHVGIKQHEFILDQDDYEIAQKGERINAGKQFCLKCRCPLFSMASQGKVICKNPQCGSTQEFLDSHFNPLSTGDSDDQNSQHNKYSQFISVLKPFQESPTHQIPEVVYDDIKALMRQNRFGNDKAPNVSKISDFLSHLGYSELHEHKYQILQKVTGISLPKLSSVQEWKIVFSFLQISPAFESVKELSQVAPANTKLTPEQAAEELQLATSLKYNLICYYICRMHGYHEFCPHLPLLAQLPILRKQISHFNLMLRQLNLSFVAQLY